jgi:hypothetical protein
MIGTMWQGRENNGYLCENSLWLINARRIPKYDKRTLPRSSISDLLTTDELKYERNCKVYRSGKHIGKKGCMEFCSVYVDQDIPNQSLENVDEDYDRQYFTEDGQLRKEYQKPTPDEIGEMKYGPTRSGVNEYPELTTEVLNCIENTPSTNSGSQLGH